MTINDRLSLHGEANLLLFSLPQLVMDAGHPDRSQPSGGTGCEGRDAQQQPNGDRKAD